MKAAAHGSAPNLLVELGAEELPPKALKRLGERFAAGIAEWLAEHDFLNSPTPAYRWFATPRRLAALVEAVRERQPEQLRERRGPAVARAFDDDGRPSKAATAFAHANGVAVEDLERLATEKGEWLVFRHRVAGQSLAAAIEACVRSSVERLPVPKRMRWGAGDAEFVRPVHWLVVLHGDAALEAEVLGVAAGRHSFGHRFHAPGRLPIAHADAYVETLKNEGSVWVDYEERKLEIYLQAEKAAKKIGALPVVDDDLLEEVAGLVERCEMVTGKFDERFLEVPREVLVSSMRDHQKYFHLVDRDGNLAPHFIAASNIRSREPERVRSGNERVLRARLTDAEFFWREDLKQSLESRVESLKGLMFHRRLGSVYDKTRRVAELAGRIARDGGFDADACTRAAWLAKADLVSLMVGEFPELQGTMGRYYALHDGEPARVALAVEEHYLPRHAGDALPAGEIGRAISVADRIDTLCGIFATGEEPTGDKDPYALRRRAQGLIRTLVEGRLDLDVEQLIEIGAGLYESCGIEIPAESRAKAVAFIVDRYPAYYGASGYGPDEIAAVSAVRPTRPRDLDRRLRALFAFRRLPASESLAAANKRIGNILKRSEPGDRTHIDPDLLAEPAEQDLARCLVQTGAEVLPLIRRGEYAEALERLAGLREPIDAFFDDVMVMDPDEGLRNNRLALLRQLSGLFKGVADISRLQPRQSR